MPAGVKRRHNGMRLFGIGFTAFIILVLFGKVYMAATRPVAPLPVSKTLEYYAPGLEIGKPVASTRSAVRDLRFVAHLGFVGTNTRRGEGSGLFSQVRLLLSPEWRSKSAKAAEKAPIDAVELVTAQPYMSSILFPQLTGTFLTKPRVGCIRTSAPDRLREVRVWTTKNDMGGAAVISDWDPRPKAPRTGETVGQVVVNLILYGGKFDGSRTLRANYLPFDCSGVGDLS